MGFLTLNNLGALAAMVVVVVLLGRYRGVPHRRPLPRYGHTGAWLLIGSMTANALGVAPVEMFFTPLCWTGYILWADGAVAALRARSLLTHNRRAFVLLAGASIPLWIIFELYNLRLANWLYAGLPGDPVIRYASYGWAFATIWPGVFITAALLRAMQWCVAEESAHSGTTSRGGVWPMLSMALGVLFLAIPPLLPQQVSAWLFGFVWLGPTLLLEPLNMRAGRPSLWADLRAGDSSRLRALLWAGAICGLMWEFWNHSAAARWVYIFPILRDYRIFAMPLPGYLGFPVFALDCFAMYSAVEPALLRLLRTRVGTPAVLEL